MKAYEITFSPTGGTKKVSDIIMTSFPWEKEEISLLHEPALSGAYEFSQEDICLLAVPSFGGRVPRTAAERLLSMKGNGARAVLVCVYGNRAYEDTLLELKNIAEQAGFLPVAAVAAVAQHSIMKQFAAGRPDEEDTQELQAFGERIYAKLMAGEASPLTVPGNEPYRAYGCIAFLPTAGEDCTNCGLCAKECPVNAIDATRPQETNAQKCISCMRCISVCPKKARGLDEAMLTAVSQKMEKAFAEKKKNEIY